MTEKAYIQLSENEAIPQQMIGTTIAARRLGITVRTLYRFINEGMIPGFKVGRSVKLRESDVAGFIVNAKIEPGSLSHLHSFPRSDDPPIVDNGTVGVHA